MDRKRKLPARAAARIEQAAKKGRTSTPGAHRSATPSSALNGTPVPEDSLEQQQPQLQPQLQLQPPQPPPPPLPTSIQPGKPLPTVEDGQPEDLSLKDYQSIQESGVLAESLARSRQRWISDGLFEKYWTKPTKKKGVIQEDPKNPAKDSMTKVGQVIISLEPHYFEATMYAVKDPNKPAPQPVSRPILQYGPPNGTMPPPPTPSSKFHAPAATAAASRPQAPIATSPAPSAQASPIAPQPPNAPTATMGPASHPAPASSSAAPQIAPAMASTPISPQHVASPRGMEAMLSSSTAPPEFAQRPVSVPPPIAPQVPIPSPSPANSAAGPSHPPPMPSKSPAPLAPTPTPSQGASRAAPQPPAVKPAPGADPIIVTLAEKANEDPQLRDLMKRVANGNAPKDELARFQAIIDQITAESKKKAVIQGPSAERLFVDGKTVRYFADEVDTIASIVLRTNPKQTSAHLSVPPDSNALVVELVKAALDDHKIMERVRRIAKNVPTGSDTTDLKDTLERLKAQLEQRPVSSAGSSKLNGAPNGQANPAVHTSHIPPPQQALRSKGPPPAVKPEVSAVVFEFGGGNGDRYLFPKFSIVEQVQSASGPQVIASFLIVRKGSASEYGCDPNLDYYQPITVRISSTQPKYLEYFSRIVAPQDEVKRYMEEIMDNMTRAEYILLAMKLPRPEKEPKDDGHESGKDSRIVESHHATPETDMSGSEVYRKGLTWKVDKTMKLLAKPAAPQTQHNGKTVEEQHSYQDFIASVGRKETAGAQ
ncbi:unnamed protein product [Discula destructiva]